jgi:hypothetical protein
MNIFLSKALVPYALRPIPHPSQIKEGRKGRKGRKRNRMVGRKVEVVSSGAMFAYAK